MISAPGPAVSKIATVRNKKVIERKCKTGLPSLRKLKDILPQSKMVRVYRAMFESHLKCDLGEIYQIITHLQTLQGCQARLTI